MKGDLGYIRSLDESFQDTLLPGALIVGLAYTAIGIIHWSMPRAGLPFLGPTEVFLGVSTLVLFAFLRRWKQRGERFSVLTSRILGAAIVAPVLVNNALYLNIRAEPQHAFGFYILLVGTGMIPFTARWYASIAGTALFAWGLSVLRSDAPLEAFVEPGVTILAMTALGTAMHVWRFRYAERMDSLREDAARSHEARALRSAVPRHGRTSQRHDHGARLLGAGPLRKPSS